ncbi:hypothetical protein L0B53_16175 [Vibrio sp. SS-MA-C1-2]|uniref:hypothetical protein n=1 Tax=Vibrio sp. SS-MA-C1-2 TaxID=2908646 RepID=UPI001F1AD246|nr:hypothetical protein [Vibrio sp. SS-MA-C1-2]UJF18537.1 hypothetical protein L0B53_16175 [Vibrio sp. SS-MA-C1-2]
MTPVYLSEMTIKDHLFSTAATARIKATQASHKKAYTHLSTLLTHLKNGKRDPHSSVQTVLPSYQADLLSSVFTMQFNQENLNMQSSGSSSSLSSLSSSYLFSDLSRIWLNTSRHQQKKDSKKWIKSLQTIPNIQRINDDKNNTILRLSMEPNQAYAKRYHAVIEDLGRTLFAPSFHLIMNRKTDSTRTENIIKTYFAKRNTRIHITKKDEGKTAFYIDLECNKDIGLAKETQDQICEYILFYYQQRED